MESNKKVGAIKQLLEEGFTEKNIMMVMQVQQPYVNKIKNGKLHRDTPILEDAMSPQESARYNAIRIILSTPELPTNKLEEQDIIYMHLLKFFMIKKDAIAKIYNNIGISRIDKILRRKDIDLGNFDSTLLGIPRDVYLDLIIDYI